MTYDEPSPKWSEIQEGKESKVELTLDLWDIKLREQASLLTVLRNVDDHRQRQETQGRKNNRKRELGERVILVRQKRVKMNG